MLRIDKSGDAVPLLRLCDHMQCNRSLTTGFRTIDFDDTSAGNTAEPQRNIQSQRTGRDSLHVHMRVLIAQLHDRTLAICALNIRYCRFQCF